MKFLSYIFLAVVATTLLSCSSPTSPKVENCKIGCESRSRHSEDFIESCKRMCEKYK